MKNKIFWSALLKVKTQFIGLWVFLFLLAMAGKTPYQPLTLLGITFIFAFFFIFSAVLVAYLYYKEDINKRLNKN